MNAKFIYVTILALCSFIFSETNAQTGNVGIGTSFPDGSSILDVTSISKGLLLPRMTLNQRNLISLPANGLLIYQTDNTPGLYYNSGASGAPLWKLVGNNAGQWQNNGSSIYYTAGNVGIGTGSPAAKLQVVNGDAIINDLTMGRGGGSQTSNSAFGFLALNANTSGNYNTAIGRNVLFVNSDGESNTACGYYALASNTAGNNNTAYGRGALFSNISGTANVAMGMRALYNSTNQSFLVAVGDSALHKNGIGATGVQATCNTAIGSKAMFSNTVGRNSTAQGYNAMYNSISGDYNTATGHLSLFTNTTGDRNTATGSQALYYNTDGTYNTASGYAALYHNTSGDHNTAVGYVALYDNTTANNNTSVGYGSMYNNATGYSNVAVGVATLFENIDRSNLVAVGDSALFNNGKYVFFNTDAVDNTAIGSKAMFSNYAGFGNAALGSGALYANLDADYNVAVGHNALFDFHSYNGNTAVGAYSGDDFDGEYGTFLGFYTGSQATGYINNATAIGYHADVDADDQVRIGNAGVTSIGGYSSWTTLPSDGSYKTDISENVPGLPFILRLRPVTFHLDMQKLGSRGQKTHGTDGSDTEIERNASEQYLIAGNEKAAILYSGFIAQEVELSARAIGYDFSGVDAPKSENGIYGLRYAEFVVPLVKAVQEQQDQIEQLKADNAALKEMLIALERKLSGR